MDYNIIETYNEKKYCAKVVFESDIQNYLLYGDFNISVYDLLADGYIELNSWSDVQERYGLTAPFTSAEAQITNSLVNNKGIVIYYVPDEKTLYFIMIPRCKNVNNDVIGYYTSTIHFNAIYNNDTISVDFVAKLYPRIIRADSFEKYVPEAEDPILPSAVKRPEYTFPDIYPDGRKISHNLRYDTIGQIYVNTNAKPGPEGIAVEESPEITDPAIVPIYTSRLSAYFMTDYDDSFYLDLNGAKSCLYNDKNLSEIPIDYSYKTTPYVSKIQIIQTEQDAGYWTEMSAFDVTQYIYTDKIGRFENKLFFGLSASHHEVWPPVVPPHELYNPDYIVYNVTPKYVTSADLTTEYTFEGRTPRLLQIDWNTDLLEEGLEDITINFDPLETHHNAFLYDRNYENALLYIIDVNYYDENDFVITGKTYTGEKEITASTMKFSTRDILNLEGNNLINLIDRNDLTYKKATVNINFGVGVNDELFQLDPIENKKIIETYPYYINADAVSALGWREFAEINDWTKNEEKPVPPPPPPPVIYTAPKTISFALKPYKQTPALRMFNPSDDRILLVNMNEPDTIEVGTEGINLEIYTDSNKFINNDDKVQITYKITYPDTGVVDTGVKELPVISASQNTIVLANIFENIFKIDLRNENTINALVDVSVKVILNDPTGTRAEEIKSEYQIDLDMNPTWNDGGMKSTEWTRNYEKFIPNQWDAFSNYVIFTKSPLTIKDSYIGAKSIYAPCLFARNAIVEAEIFIEGDRPAAGSNNACLSMDNLNTTTRVWSDGTSKQKYNPESHTIEPTHQVGGNLYLGVTTPLTTDIKILQGSEYQGVQNSNNSALANASIEGLYATFEKSPNLESLNAEFTGTIDIPVDGGQTYDFDASVENQFRNIQIMNNATLRFKKGTYYFKNFRAETNLTIIVDTLAEDEYVRIYVENDCFISNLSNIENSNTHMLSFMIYSQNGNILLEAATQNLHNYGVLVAPNGTVEFRNGIIWTGAVWANNVLIESSSELHSFGS